MQNQQNEQISNNHFQISKGWKWLIYCVLIVIMLMAGFAIYINLKWKPFLTRQIQEAIITSTDSLYSISFQSVSVNILTGSATFKKMVFKPDSLVYIKMIKNGAAPKHLFTVEVARLDLNRIHPFKVYFQRKLEMKSLLIDRPKVKMSYQKLSQPQNIIIDKRNAWQRLSKYLRSIKVDDIIFQDADFEYIDKSARQNQLTRLRNLDIEIAGLLIDSASQFDKSKLYHTDNISVRLDNYEWRAPNGMYDVKLKGFSASTRYKFAKFTGLQLVPRYSEMQFSQKLKSRTERYALRFDEILLEQIDFKAFNTDRRLIASKAKISNSNASIFINKEFPHLVKDRSLSFPQIALRQINLETRIDSVLIHNARVAYSEYSPASQRKGLLFFDQIEGTIINLTNDSATLAKSNICTSNLTGLIMGRGRLNVELKLDLTHKASAFTIKGNVGNMNASLFNQITRPLTLVEIRSGFVEHMQFSIDGNLKGTKGQLHLKYNDLKIKILSKNEGNSGLKKMGIASMAANVLILKGENPSPGENLRGAKIQYSRPDSASFINMVWKGMLGGLKETIGLDPTTQHKIASKLRELKKEKAEREERRDERLKRKEERRSRNKK